jgi:hypothetical protein
MSKAFSPDPHELPIGLRCLVEVAAREVYAFLAQPRLHLVGLILPVVTTSPVLRLRLPCASMRDINAPSSRSSPLPSGSRYFRVR